MIAVRIILTLCWEALIMKRSVKIVIAGIITVVLIALGLYLALKPKVKFNENLVFEYGEGPILVDVLYDVKSIASDKIEFLDQDTVITELPTTQVGKNEVVAVIKKGNKTKQYTIKYTVEDTTAPVLEGVADIEVDFGKTPQFNQIKAVDPIDGYLDVEIKGDYDINQAGTYALVASSVDQHGNSAEKEFTLTVREKKASNKPSEVEITYVGGHIFVNKKFGLPSTYNPGENPEARAQINKLNKDMRDLGLNIGTEMSGFRTYQRQKELYDRYVKNDGVAAADRYSARPGHSDHQSGLTFDLKNKSGQLMGDNDPIESKKEIDWVADNAHRYGFIVRYPKGKESITGYIYEPWHLRYLGVEDATKVYNSGLTMEEYFKMPGGGYADE